MNQYAMGIDIGGSHLSTCILELSSGRLIRESLRKKEIDNQASATVIINVWTSCIQESLAALDVPLVGLGFAFPGPFDYANGICRIEGVNKFSRLYGLDVTYSLLSALKWQVKIPMRYINDAGAFALGEAVGGCARDFRRIIALTLGTGVGSGFIADKQLIESGPAVPKQGWVYHLPFEGGIADEAFSTRWFCRRFFELTGNRVSGAKEIAEQASTQPLARQLFREYGRRLAQFVLPLVRQFGAECLVLGGNISQAYSLFQPSLEEYFHQQKEKLTVRLSSLRDNAAMLGAASLFRENECINEKL